MSAVSQEEFESRLLKISEGIKTLCRDQGMVNGKVKVLNMKTEDLPPAERDPAVLLELDDPQYRHDPKALSAEQWSEAVYKWKARLTNSIARDLSVLVDEIYALTNDLKAVNEIINSK